MDTKNWPTLWSALGCRTDRIVLIYSGILKPSNEDQRSLDAHYDQPENRNSTLGTSRPSTAEEPEAPAVE